jgi:hypothetical protein
LHAQLKEQFIFCAANIYSNYSAATTGTAATLELIRVIFRKTPPGALARRCFMACKFLAENPFIGHFSCIPLHVALATLVFASSSLDL